MSESSDKLTFDLTHCYIEVARSALTSFHHQLELPDFNEKFGRNVFPNALLAVMSISIVYSYLSVESFVNYQLFQIWQRRRDGSPESGRFLELLGDEEDFENLKSSKRARELGARYKTLCRILAFKSPVETQPTLWQGFKELLELSRHFLVHPYPDKEYFQKNLSRIGGDVEAGRYADIAQRLIGHLYEQSGAKPPIWLGGNTLIRFRGVELLAGKSEA